MRTPGDDEELALGYLCGEGILRGPQDVASVAADGERVVVELAPGLAPELSRLDRAFATTSACGVCGKSSLEALRLPAAPPLPAGPVLDPALVHRLPSALREAQGAFALTGGLHAAALFDAAGALLVAHEDVGRHNAVDKVVGALLRAGRLPPPPSVLMVSGRASFELVAKARVASVPVLAAVGAPSSLAVSLAAEHGMTLLGFVRDGRFNVYAGAGRVRLS